MDDKQIFDDIKKCSRCALCLSNCPIYDIKKDENYTSRGLICKLLGYKKNEVLLNSLKKDLKICLFCQKCKKNCPSKINTTKIFIYKNAFFSPSKFNQKIALFLKLLPIKFLYFLNFLNFFKFISKNDNKTQKAFYFKGCMAKAQHKKTFLDKYLFNPNFSCCGLPYLALGDLKNYNKAKEKNIELIKKAASVVFDCATCYSSVLEYNELNENDKSKLIFLNDLFKNKKINLKFNSKYKNKIITFHKPCHLDEKEFLKIENLLKSIPDITYTRLENYDDCCGFGGSYFVFHPITSFKIALKKSFYVKKSSCDLILTSCPSCALGLRFNQLVSLNFKKTLELRDFIDKELVIN